MVEIPAEFEELKFYTEAEQFIEQFGEMYCVRESCDDCPYKDDCEHTEGALEIHSKTPVRMCIGIDNQLAFSNDDAYKPGLDYDEFNELSKEHNLRYLSNSGYLPESKNVVIKEVEEREAPYIVYNEQDDKYYCIRQVCSECEHFKECNPKLSIQQRKYITVALDLSSQEPRCNAIVSKEPKWIDVFQNNTLKKEHTEIWNLINELFHNLGVQTQTDKTFWLWCDKMFFRDMTEGYFLYILYADSKLDPNNKSKLKALAEQIEYLHNDYLEFSRDKSRKTK